MFSAQISTSLIRVDKSIGIFKRFYELCTGILTTSDVYIFLAHDMIVGN